MIAVSQDGHGFKFGMMKVEPYSPALEAEVASDLKLLKWPFRLHMMNIPNNEKCTNNERVLKN